MPTRAPRPDRRALAPASVKGSPLSESVPSPTPAKEKVRLRLSPQAEKYARRDAPLEVRRMAARGALPLEPLELATVLLVLANDPDAAVKDTARKSLETLPEPVLGTVLRGPAHPALLSLLAQLHKGSEAHCEAIALNPATDDATIAWLATLPHSRVVDIISQNQERMMRHEEIVDALGEIGNLKAVTMLIRHLDTSPAALRN